MGTYCVPGTVPGSTDTLGRTTEILASVGLHSRRGDRYLFSLDNHTSAEKNIAYKRHIDCQGGVEYLNW